jgi:hypothetical protein
MQLFNENIQSAIVRQSKKVVIHFAEAHTGYRTTVSALATPYPCDIS